MLDKIIKFIKKKKNNNYLHKMNSIDSKWNE